jgi:ubiquinone/menaquinone biosynthesis C-methylase UbiE
MSEHGSNEIQMQRDYYSRTAGEYDQLHVDADEKDEHYLALAFMVSALDYYGIESILDVGSGTGRALQYIKQRKPGIRVAGIEPVQELRQIGHAKGLAESELIDGDVTHLNFADGEFDLVCEFGVLHHVKDHDGAVSEMLRVARKAVFISDSNNFGQGSFPVRCLKQLIHALGLWRVADYLKTKGKGYTISEEDGLAYSYSVFDDYRQIQSQCKTIHLLNTEGGQINPYRTASHVALLGVKSQ